MAEMESRIPLLLGICLIMGPNQANTKSLGENCLPCICSDRSIHVQNTFWIYSFANCSHKNLQGIPTRGHLGKIDALYLAHNNISSLTHQDLKLFKNLKVLDISYNSLTEIPKGTFEVMSQLRYLNLHGNHLVTLFHEVLKPLSKLTVLKLDIESLSPRMFEFLPSLDNLYLTTSDNKVTRHVFQGANMSAVHLYLKETVSIPWALFAPIKASIENISITAPKLASIPENIFDNLEILHSISLEVVDVEIIPDHIFHGSNHDNSINGIIELLERFGIFHERLFMILNMLREKRPIRRVTVNGFKIIPEHLFKHLPFLESIELHNVTTIPRTAFKDLEELQDLDMTGNDITAIDLLWWQDLKRLKNLDLSNNKIEEILPGDISSLPNLETLGINDNNVKDISEGALWEVAFTLKSLDLSGNNLTELPPLLLDSMPNLEELDLGQNSLNDLPVDIFASAPNLKELSLSGNSITELDPNITHGMQNLEKLNLSGNGLQNMPGDFFENLIQLRTLDVSGNNASTIPLESLQNVTNLEIKHFVVACDCGSVGLLDAIVNKPSWKITGWCGSPSELEGRRIETLNRSEMCALQTTPITTSTNPTTVPSSFKPAIQSTIEPTSTSNENDTVEIKSNETRADGIKSKDKKSAQTPMASAENIKNVVNSGKSGGNWWIFIVAICGVLFLVAVIALVAYRKWMARRTYVTHEPKSTAVSPTAVSSEQLV